MEIDAFGMAAKNFDENSAMEKSASAADSTA
jgi:hypothetical protein